MSTLLRAWNRPSAIRYARVDMCTRYSAMQYLIILFEPAEAQIPKVMERVFTQYYQLYDEKPCATI